jgi:hypothetical protein
MRCPFSLGSCTQFIRRPGNWERFALAVLFLCALASPLYSDQVTINFEGFADGTAVTTQYAGLAFSNAAVATAGVSLNEFEFPPHSGLNVAFDNGGPITIVFSNAVSSFDAFFTYSVPLTLDAFNSSNTLVASANSLFSNNEGISGVPDSSPNERIQVSSSGGISSVEIMGAASGGSYTIDDVTYSTSTSIPEPGSLILALAGSAMLIAFRQRSFVAGVFGLA